MAEIFVRFSEPVVAKDGSLFLARACGSELDHLLWQGWVEFVPADGGPPIRTGRETTQPNRRDTEYWATGLTPVYLEGALERALNRRSSSDVTADGPIGTGAAAEAEMPPSHESVLNPFSVYRKGESLLRSQLSALSGWHLVNIIEAYRLSEQRTTELESASPLVLVELIIAAVREQVTASAER